LEEKPNLEAFRARYNDLLFRVTEYYKADKDQKLLKSIELGIWVL